MKFIIPIFLLILSAGCSIKAPEVRVTGEMTALEQEVIGTYHQMEEDTWMIASTRDDDEKQMEEISSEKKKVLEALREQKFNKDDIDDFKRKGYVGENCGGLLEIRELKKLEDDPDKKKFVIELVKEENYDRKIIMDRVIELNFSLKDSEKKDVLGVFAKMYQDGSPKGSWIEFAEGVWKKK